PLHDPFVDLRHLLAEELDQQAGMSPRQDDLRALGSELDVENEGADAIALPVALARDLFLLRQDRVGPAEVHDDVLLLEALHDAGDELAFAALELVVDDVALDPLLLAHLLDDAVQIGQHQASCPLLRRAPAGRRLRNRTRRWPSRWPRTEARRCRRPDHGPSRPRHPPPRASRGTPGGHGPDHGCEP